MASCRSSMVFTSSRASGPVVGPSACPVARRRSTRTALAGVHLHRRDAEVEQHEIGLEALLGQQRQGLRVVHAQEAGLAGHLRRQLLVGALGSGIPVHADEGAAGAEAVGHQPRMTARAERAVDRGLPRRRRRQVDQLPGEDGYVRARHVKKDRQAPRSPPRCCRPARSAPRASAPGPRSRGGRPRRPRPRPCRSPRARGAASGKDHPAGGVQLDVEGVALEEALDLLVLRARGVLAREGALDDRLVGAGVHAAMQASESLARTRPDEKAARNRAGCSAGASRRASVRSGL